MKFFISTVLLASCLSLSAQNGPEFPREFIMHLKLHNGMMTTFRSTTPDLYVGGVQLIPQYTFVPGVIRGGIVGGVFYGGKKIQALIGPTVSVKLASLKAKPFGTLGNIHLTIDHLWGSEKQKLAGAGLNADIGNWVVFGFSIHRDYNLNNWWIQNTLGLRISKVKKQKPIDL